MRTIKLGSKKKNIKYKFRETCFGIVFKDNEFYVTEKDGEISLIGGGIDNDETHEETLRREFIEEAGLKIKEIIPFVTIDCYWHTRDDHEMNSLANFYIVKVEDDILEPTESVSKLVLVSKDEIMSKLLLPYQYKAMQMFLDWNKN